MDNTLKNTLKDRVKLFLDFSEIRQSDFARLAKVTTSYVSNIGNNITVPILEVLKGINKNLSLDWLLLGRGEMLVPGVEETAKKINDLKAKHAAEVEKLQKEKADLSEKVSMLQEIADLKKQLKNG